MQSIRPPSFDIADPSGRRLTVEPNSSADTVADLVSAVGAPPCDEVVVDGRVVSTSTLLTSAGIGAGSRVDRWSPPSRSGASPASDPFTSVVVDVIGGPDCRVDVRLPPGRHLVGRMPTADLHLDDPSVELHHGVVEVATDGVVTFTQLTGPTPVTVDGIPGVGTFVVAPGAVLSLGASQLTVGPSDHADRHAATGPVGMGRLAASPTNPWRRHVIRAPVLVDAGGLGEIVAPEPPDEPSRPPSTGLVAAGVVVLGALVVAVVLGQVMFAMFALIGAVTSFATWAVGWFGWQRRRRAARRGAASALDGFAHLLDAARSEIRRVHQHEHPPVADGLRIGAALLDRTHDESTVWARRVIGESPALSAVVGVGRHRWTPEVQRADGRPLPPDLALVVERATDLDELSATIVVAAGEVVALRGHFVGSIARSIVVQSAVGAGPADWRLVVVTSSVDAWRWVAWLPHATDAAGRCTVFDSTDRSDLEQRLAGLSGVDRPVLLVVDDPGSFDLRTGAVRRFIEMSHAHTLAVVESSQTTPTVCRRVLDIGATGRATWHGSGAGVGDVVDVRIAGVSVVTAETIARSLHGLVDPEDVTVVGGPASVTLTEIEPVAGIEHDQAVSAIVECWAAHGRDPAPVARVGMSCDGVVDIDLVRDGPHALIAGTTGSGKSEFLRTLVVGLACRSGPDHLTFVLVDYKGGSTFDACADLPHTVGLVTDLDGGLAERALTSLVAELHRRESLLRDVGAGDLAEYRRRSDTPPLPRLVIIVDEFAALARELPDFLAAIVGVAQRGRSLGVHLVLATQRPAGVVNDDIRANTDLRLALRLNDVADANDVIGDATPARFPREVPGRAALRLGPGELVVFQAARCTVAPAPQGTDLRVVGCEPPTVRSVDRTTSGAESTELSAAVEAIVAAAQRVGVAEPHRPWLEPLPDEVSPSDVDAVAGWSPHDAVGVVDVPAAQSRRPLRWRHGAGNLELAGALGAGTTSTLVALLAARCRVVGPERLHCYVVDARGDGALDGLSSVAHCGGLVRLGERERLHRLIRRLATIVEARADGAFTDDVSIVFAIDGLPALYAALDSVDGAPTLAMLDRVLADGPAVDVTSVWTTDGGGRRRAGDAQRWRFTGVTPGRLVEEMSGLTAQVAKGAAGLAALPDRVEGQGPADIRELPDHVTYDPSTWSDPPCPRTDTLTLAVGLRADDLGPATLSVPPLDHLFVGGAARSGKSTAVAQLVAAWRAARPRGRVVVVDRLHPLTAPQLVDRESELLVVVDDADRVDDHGGLLADLVTSGYPGITVLAAARIDAVRSAYGHWTRDVVRSRCGLLLTSAGELDGELLGVVLPRRTQIVPRPGLGWLIDGGGYRLVQVARPVSASVQSMS